MTKQSASKARMRNVPVESSQPFTLKFSQLISKWVCRPRTSVNSGFKPFIYGKTCCRVSKMPSKASSSRSRISSRYSAMFEPSFAQVDGSSSALNRLWFSHCPGIKFQELPRI